MSFFYQNIRSIRVVDGDTVEMEIDTGFHCRYQFPFRLMGINAPEGKNTEAAQWLRDNLVPSIMTVETHKPDKYGRWLATIYLDGASVNSKLVELGLAVPYGGGKRE